MLNIEWGDGTSSEFSSLWLRDNLLEDRDPHSGQRLSGPMAAHEVAKFETERFYKEAVRVRHWDDQGKVTGLKTPVLTDYRTLIEQFTIRAG